MHIVLSLRLMVISLQRTFSGDRILCFSYNKRDKKLEDHGIAANVKPGSGPRHLVFSPMVDMLTL